MLKISIFVLLTLTLMTPMAFGQEEIISNQKIELSTDNLAYREGDVITITGTVEKVMPGMPISLQVFFGKNLMQVSQVKVSHDGQFSDTFTAAGPQWNNEGTVLIKASYGGAASTELEISFFKNTPGEYQSSIEVKIPEAGTFDVPYTMKGGNISSIELVKRNLSLQIHFLAQTDGILNINLSRDSIDSISNEGQDIEFIVLIYEKNSEIPIQTNYKEIQTDDEYRGISIPIKKGDEKIEIVGTHVVPEFGTIAMIVLAVAIVSIIAVSAKSRLSIMPRI